MTRTTLTLLALTLAACTDNGEAGTEATGAAMYRDAQTDADGTPKQPANPEPQPNNDPMTVELRVEGTGTFDVPDPECQADALTGAFDALYSGEATIDDDGVYTAFFAESAARFDTPSGCTIPDLEIGLVTDLVVRGELTATERNCDTYCAAKARAYGEEECSASTDAATCRSEAEAAYEASCTTTCTSGTSHVIVAETSLGASALTNLDLGTLTGTALGTIEADLTFDHIEDDQGNTVDEGPTGM